MKNIKSLVTLFLVLVLILLGIFLYYRNNQNIIEDQNKKSLGVLENFMIADVVSLNGDVLLVNAGGSDTLINLTKNTILIQQIKDDTGYKNITAKREDIKAGNRVVVFYKPDFSDGYVAERIQILNF